MKEVLLGNILTVAGSEQSLQLMQQLLQEQGLSITDSTDKGLLARQLLESKCYDLVIVNTPLLDEHGEAIARIAYQQNAEVILLIKPEHADAVYERIGHTGIYMIPKPLKRAVFFQTLQCIQIQRMRLEKLQQEKGVLDRQIKDAKLLNRAKLLLMQVLKLSEAQAHHYIEKQAMDLRISKREVAEGIISTYET